MDHLRRVMTALFLPLLLFLGISGNVFAAIEEDVCVYYRSTLHAKHRDALEPLIAEAKKSAPNGILAVCTYEGAAFFGSVADVYADRSSGDEYAWVIGFERAFEEEASLASIRFLFLHEVGHLMIKHYRVCTTHFANGDRTAYISCESEADRYAAERVGYCEAARALEELGASIVRRHNAASGAEILAERAALLRKDKNCSDK
ncbi:MAG: hypothetical protein A3C93_06220 [Candidatus Lloydbacteria bacterium RIFCSPHIGHO2_02_FULL_54_17]|uniref:Peptidase M48 domain-containing protein n=1 Tax=Candidatus Lloydbacteria bacterium RIFCSPHIGHO2_02_FULL_54_17 TaxID=1798664 RepID=A0A1G2DGN4_9BACT|nr:MAG: hypothetical protein A2762_02500 [Candidatus Lloydbacteria bacterium RIFCSPHIGHO2_01_FULL_54_11]OGZ12673.1 MAG: hypothetical protein A3C93_06220 [Candidatus Lloydbacteria bacterium RIFCSPHIGHO2_02_FULL_54_17]OGZ13525.1 MAG: hypothetical protein A2948_04885 [Candidatus Lloydbacteria bacterium RIFCSPLOWO2_01_FULL_54_18]OGZ16196.1 MAG: hypothetical protein A3H76_03720 [Candidatus Lloydbacteria bacterium RIFCSPLOWO2_02_FULL_54_12]